MMAYTEILLVDDEPHILRALKRELRRFVAHIHTAESGQQALDILTQHQIGLVISDYRMPNMNGAELLINIHQRYPGIATIMLSGQADLHGVSKAINAGALSQYVSKPWDRDVLCDTVKTILTNKQASLPNDTLTACLSMQALNQRIQNMAIEEKTPWLVAMIDTQGTNSINETQTVMAGNQRLQRVSEHLYQLEIFNWYRVADKFVGLLEYSSEGHCLLNELIESLHCAREEKGLPTQLMVSALRSWQEVSFENIQARKAGKIPLYDALYWLPCPEEHQDDAMLRTLIRDIEAKHFEAFYQPQLNIVTGEIDGFEALVRRRLESGGYQSPADFLPLLSQYQLDDVLTTSMFEQALETIRLLRREGNGKTVSVNVTARQLESGFVGDVIQHLSPHYPDEIAHLEVELVETDRIHDFTQTHQQMGRLKSLGISCALDDFGTGFAGFESMCDLPFDVIKIDGRFVRNIGQSEMDEVILTSISQSAKLMNVEVVAEWVENQNQIDFLREKGCTRVQGYGIGAPLSQDKLFEFLNTFKQSENPS
ncbi:EAL domain-containing protein [Salinivibrio sp. ES.052]|uniref:EAL domain-containing protein n=1 Tax=Salinivibrio sp. ES.052 TaxID=1882823 RepID=UPI000926ED35|nr:EAL domain-containing protein [Salinivibrio sp. ES.052]SIO35586.1 EAL domain, c-di-GMP-specific phosphodiesterase class I (or its enzymatically inactive variant) [Salinivibrio sp. ES.052]